MASARDLIIHTLLEQEPGTEERLKGSPVCQGPYFVLQLSPAWGDTSLEHRSTIRMCIACYGSTEEEEKGTGISCKLQVFFFYTSPCEADISRLHCRLDIEAQRGGPVGTRRTSVTISFPLPTMPHNGAQTHVAIEPFQRG